MATPIKKAVFPVGGPGTRFDCGSKAGSLEANVAFALARDDLRDEARRICRADA